jgi:hypothetical protein
MKCPQGQGVERKLPGKRMNSPEMGSRGEAFWKFFENAG